MDIMSYRKRFPIHNEEQKEFWEWTIHLSGEEEDYKYCKMCVHYECCVANDDITGQNRLMHIPSRCLHGPPSVDEYGVGVFPLMEAWQSCHQFNQIPICLSADIITLVTWDCGGKKVYRRE